MVGLTKIPVADVLQQWSAGQSAIRQHTWQAWPRAEMASRQHGMSSWHGSTRSAAAEPCRVAGLLLQDSPLMYVSAMLSCPSAGHVKDFQHGNSDP